MLGHSKVISTKRRRDVNYACSIFGGNKISSHHLKCFVSIIERLQVRHQLFVTDTNYLFTQARLV